MKIELSINSFSDELTFPDADVNEVHRPLLNLFESRLAEANGRAVILLAAPPGAGKSSVAAFWAWLSTYDMASASVQDVGVDGFHYPRRYLESQTIVRDGQTIPLASIKGAPETYDAAALCGAVAALKSRACVRWPRYDRTVHDPVPDAIDVTAPIVVVEGNWLLLDEPPWRSLNDIADLSIYLETDEASVRDGLINRKIRGGVSRPLALTHYDTTDRPNIERANSQRLSADIELSMRVVGGVRTIQPPVTAEDTRNIRRKNAR